MVNISYPLAFGAGIVSFFAPCVLPLLPAYVGYITGVSLKELEQNGYGPYRRKILTTSLFYIIGFSLVFVLLGSAAASIGGLLRQYDFVIQRLGGLIILILGLEFAGFLHIPLLSRTRQFTLPAWTKKFGHLRSFFIGLVFATAWTPCIGAVLGSILTLAAVSGTAAQGALLLFIYSLGISVPFLIVSLSLASAPKYLSVVQRNIGVLSKIAGMTMVIIGFLLLTNTYRYVNSWVFSVTNSFGWAEFLVNII